VNRATRLRRRPPVANRAATVVLIAAAVASVVAGCSPAASSEPGPIATGSIEAPASGSPAAPSGSPETPSSPASPVEGVLVDIDSAGLADVDGFTLRLGDGRTVAFRVGILENGDEFPVGHLAEHLATSAPVRVFFRTEGPDLVVYRVEDAG
jgi:hypothetical protein